MLSLNTSDSKRKPHAVYSASAQCDECHRTNCSSLRTYSTSIDCALWAELSKVDEELTPLYKRRLDILWAINHRTTINQLPVEIISGILIYSVKFNSIFSTHRSGKSYYWSPLIALGAVCKQWRDITLATPQLWTTITIQPYRDSYFTDIVNDWLQRSGSRPLLLTLTSPYDMNKEPHVDLQPILGIIRSYSARWKSLTFGNIPKVIYHGLLDNLENTSQVETLRIDCGKQVWYQKAISMRKPFCPKRLDGTNMNHATGTLCAATFLQWDNLTHLDSQNPNVNDLMYIIRHAIKFEHCVVKYPLWEGDEHPLPSIPFINPSLLHLDIEINNAIKFLQHITLPSLHTLECHYKSHSLREGHVNILASFINRSQAPLRNVIFHPTIKHGPSSPSARFWDTRLPDITHLKLTIDIQDTYVIDKMLELLAYDRDQIELPHLQELEIATLNIKSATWSHFINMFPRIPEQRNHRRPSGGTSSSLDSSSSLLSAIQFRRPLSKACINLVKGNESASHEPILIEVDHYLRLLDIQRSGVELQLIDRDGLDILHSASKAYGSESQARQLINRRRKVPRHRMTLRRGLKLK